MGRNLSTHLQSNSIEKNSKKTIEIGPFYAIELSQNQKQQNFCFNNNNNEKIDWLEQQQRRLKKTTIFILNPRKFHNKQISFLSTKSDLLPQENFFPQTTTKISNFEDKQLKILSICSENITKKRYNLIETFFVFVFY